jgi:hypothetical protein
MKKIIICLTVGALTLLGGEFARAASTSVSQPVSQQPAMVSR